MFAPSGRGSPGGGGPSPPSVGRLTRSCPSSFSIRIRAGTFWVSSPSGPFTVTRPGSTATLTPSGISIGCLPIRLIRFSPDEADDLAADASLFRGLARDQAARGGEDRRAHPPEDARQAVLPSVYAAAGLRDALQVGQDALAVSAELELDRERRVGALVLLAQVLAIPLVRADDLEVRDVALLLEQAGDLLLHAGGGHRRRVVHRLVGVADAREHVCDRIGVHLVTSSIWSCRGSGPRARGRAGRSGRGRTSCRRRVAGRRGCRARTSAP